MATFNDLHLKIIRWGDERGIIKNSTPQAQLMKAITEMGQLVDALLKNNVPGVKDGVGDVIVCLMMMCAIMDIDYVDCIEHAWNEIKDRKGHMNSNGVFVKDAA